MHDVTLSKLSWDHIAFTEFRKEGIQSHSPQTPLPWPHTHIHHTTTTTTTKETTLALSVQADFFCS